MATPYLCILIAWLLCYAPKLVSSAAMAKQPEGYDNKHPRQQQAKLQGWGARAHAAHLNGFEAFAPFAAAVLVAQVGGGDPRRVAMLSIAFVISRVVYIAAYLADLDYLRSMLWLLGLLATAALFFA